MRGEGIWIGTADGDFGEMKKTETPSKSRRVGRPVWHVALVIFCNFFVSTSCLQQSDVFKSAHHVAIDNRVLRISCLVGMQTGDGDDSRRALWQRHCTISGIQAIHFTVPSMNGPSPLLQYEARASSALRMFHLDPLLHNVV